MKHQSLLTYFLIVSIGTVFLSSPLSVHSIQAFSVRHGDSVNISKEETIDEGLFISGSTVTINGSVHGDVYCAGKSVTINGDVQGDVLCAAQDIEITGVVNGNVRVVGQNIEVGADVARSMTVAGQHIHLAKNAIIHGEAVIAGQAVKLNGSVLKNFYGAGDDVSINGVIGRDLNVNAKQLFIGETASISGQGKYISDKAAIIDSNAAISQPLIQETPKPEVKSNPRPRKENFSVVGIIFSSFSLFIMGWIIVKLFSTAADKMSSFMLTSPLPTALIGAGLLFGGPIVFVLLLITIVGIPLAFTWLLVWVLILLSSTALCAFALGKVVVSRFWEDAKKSSLKQLLVGAIVLSILFALPFVGWMVKLIAMLLGSGAIAKALLHRKE